MCFDCGILLYSSWKESIFELLKENTLVALTSYRSWEQKAEEQVLTNMKLDVVMTSQLNPFHSLAYRFYSILCSNIEIFRQSTTIVNDVYQDNSYILAFKGRH